MLQGMPHKVYHGRTGKVWNVTKRAVGVVVNKQVTLAVMSRPCCRQALASCITRMMREPAPFAVKWEGHPQANSCACGARQALTMQGRVPQEEQGE